MGGVSMGNGSNAQGALMPSDGGGGSFIMGAGCARVSSIDVDGFPDQSPRVGPECTEVGGDEGDMCIPPMIAPIIARFATMMSALGGFPQTFTAESCSSKGFNTFNRNVDISSKVDPPPGLIIPSKMVRVFRE